MEKPSKFDRAMQEKLAGLEAEPSARVWAQLRDEIGTVPLSPVKGKPFAWYRAAAAVALLVLAAGGAYYFLSSPKDEAVGANTFSVHQNRTWPSHIIQNGQMQDSASPAKGLQNAQPQRYDRMLTAKPQTPRPEPKFEAPAPLAPINEIIVKQDAPQIAPPKQEAPQPPAPQVEVFASNSSPAPTGSKRSYRLPTAEDLNLANLRQKSKGILPSLAGKADEKLGIPTAYTRETTDDGEKTAFSLDLGFVKFRKVHNTKELLASND